MKDHAIDTLRRVLVGITTTALPWRQDWYAVQIRDDDGHVCETAYCVAGHVALAAGAVPDFTEAWSPALSGDRATARDTNGALLRDIAAEYLGFPPETPLTLFEANNTLADLWEISEEITDGAIVAAPELADIIASGKPRKLSAL